MISWQQIPYILLLITASILSAGLAMIAWYYRNLAKANTTSQATQTTWAGEAEEHLQTILESVQTGIMIVDAETRVVLDVNPAALEMIGAPKEQVVGFVCHEYLCPEAENCCPICDLGQTIDKSERVLLRPDGETRPIFKTVVSVNIDGRQHLIESITEITDRVRSEQALAEAHTQLDATLNALPDLMFEVDIHGRYYDFRAPNPELLYAPPEEFIGKTVSEILPPDAAKTILESLQHAAETGDHQGAVYFLETPGGPCWFELSIAVKEGDRFIALVRDITEQVNAKQELQQRNRELTTLYDATTLISSELSLESVLQTVAEQMTQAIGAGGCELSLWNQEVLVDYSAVQPADVDPPGTIYDLNTLSSSQRVLESRQPMVVQLDDPEACAGEKEWMEAQGVKTVLIVPLVVHEHVLGLLELYEKMAAREYTADEIRLIESLAAQAAIAIENGRLYDQVQQELTERKRTEEMLLRAKNDWERTFNTVPDLIMLLDKQHQILRMNKAMADRLGKTDSEVYGTTCYTLYHGTDKPPAFCPHAKLVADGQEHTADVYEERLGGTFRVSVSPLFDENGQLTGSVHVARDITQRVQAEKELEQLLQKAHRHADEMTAVSSILHALNAPTDVSEAFPIISTVLRSISGCERVSLILIDEDREWAMVIALDQPRGELGQGTRFPLSSTSAAEDVLAGRLHLTPDLAAETDFPSEQMLYQAGHCSRINLPLNIGNQVIGSLNLAWLQVAGYDEAQLPLLEQIADAVALAVEKTRLFQEIQQLAITDELTRLSNRRVVFELGQREIERAQRYNRPLAAIMLDIDHFKKVNDSYGHPVGDKVLQALAKCLLQNTRDIDIVGRYGGEEFVVLMPETGHEEAFQAAERLREQIALQRVDHENGPISISISLGVAVANQEIPDLAASLEIADQALYAAKQAGRNCVRTAWDEKSGHYQGKS